MIICWAAWAEDLRIMNRTVLVVLSNRLDRLVKPIYLQIECNDLGDILSERKLRSEPKQPIFDEIWENDEGRKDLDSCRNFKRKFGHKLQKKK
ncbi:hypothetical protein SDC9_152482 [bioreactor metagenome]|uniref:Uncharacterized protein n=1 Tax=bioreactor metagenome TaxID=1076179 RepID=A0A645EVH7_9ZZZZ